MLGFASEHGMGLQSERYTSLKGASMRRGRKTSLT